MAQHSVVVTGGAGFIGSHVAELFLEHQYEVVVIDDLSTGAETNVPAGARLERVDIVDAEAVGRVVRETAPRAVCHLAAQSSVTVSVHSPERDLAVNVTGTFNVCRAAADVGAPVVFSSTGGALYGDRAPVPSPEATVGEPLAPYGASKQAGEAYVGTWGRLHDVPNVILRLGNVYGPRQSPFGEAGVIAIFSERLRVGEPPVVFGDGHQTRDYIHVHDVARAFLAAAEGGVAGTFNVGWGHEASVLDVLSVLQQCAPRPVDPEFKALRQGELKRSALDSTRLADVLGWRPAIALDAGLRETYRYYDATTRSPDQPA